MNVGEVRTQVRALLDEGDLTFLTEAKLTVMLQAAYREFRHTITGIDTSYYEVTYNVVAPNADSLSLDGALLGPTATQPLAERLIRVLQLDAPNGRPVRALRPANSYENMQAMNSFGSVSWWLQNRTIRFNATVSFPLQIQYLPAPTVNWANTPDYIDDLSEFHDIISLLAINQYKIMDYAPNAFQDAQLAKRMADLRGYLNRTRSGSSSMYVTEEAGEGGYW